MKNQLRYLIAVGTSLLLLTGCQVGGLGDLGDIVENNGEGGAASVANPASAYCQQQGGTSTFVETETGVTDFCDFEDGRSCEEWRFYDSRGEDCNPPQESSSGAAVTVEESGTNTEDQKSTSKVYSQLCSDALDALYRSVPGFDQATVQNADFVWNKMVDGMMQQIEVQGKSITAANKDISFLKELEQFFTDNGFSADQNNMSSRTKIIEGYTRGSLVCQIYKEGSDSMGVEVRCAELE